jgi:CRP-like cAMP-binding protein
MPTVPASKFNIILRNVSRHIDLTDSEVEYFRSVLTHRRFRKKQFVLQAGEVCRHENFVVSGCLRGFHYGLDGSEYTTTLAVEDWWISDLESLIRNTPATMSIEAVEDSEVLQLARSDYESLYTRVPKFERLFRILLENAFMAHQRRLLSMTSQTAEQRYREFIERYPKFAQRVPQKHIASFLGVTPEFLSRVRKSISTKRGPR